MDPQIKNQTQPQHGSSTKETGATWTFEEQIAISLLSAGATFPNEDHRTFEQVRRRRFTRVHHLGATSRKVIKTVGRRMSQVFLRW